MNFLREIGLSFSHRAAIVIEQVIIVESILAGQAFADIRRQHFWKGIPVFWEVQRRTLLDARFGVGVIDGLL